MVGGFFVDGLPSPKGSHNVIHKGGRRKFIPASKRLRDWTKAVKSVAAVECREVYEGPVDLYVHFKLPIPKSKKSQRQYPIVPPDLDKLVRAVGDALTGFAYVDDKQIVSLLAKKSYGERTGVFIRVTPKGL